MTLEDETGQVNLVISPDVCRQSRAAARHATVMLATGTAQRQGQVVHVMAQALHDVDAQMTELATSARNFR
ncbi:MAG: hypothetical protein ACOC9P_00615 [bacterium]